MYTISISLTSLRESTEGFSDRELYAIIASACESANLGDVEVEVQVVTPIAARCVTVTGPDDDVAETIRECFDAALDGAMNL